MAGRVHFVTGEVQASSEAGVVRTLQKGDSINAGDTVISAKEASAHIRMEDGGLIALRPESQLKFDSFKFSGTEDGTENSLFTLGKGSFRAVTGLIGRNNRQSYRITTPAAVVGISGTDHEIVYLADDAPHALAGTYNKVNSGGTTLTTDQGTVNVEPGQMGYSGSMGELPQILPINPSLFNDAADAAGGFAPTMAEDLAAEPDASAAEESGEAAKVIEVVEPEEPVGSTFVLAPIAWGGDVSESFRKQTFGAGHTSLQNVQAANVRAATYFWQPWLAQVRGGLGVVNAKTVSGKFTNDNVGLNGRGSLSLVPYSRFPFTASYYATDSRAGTGAQTIATDFVGNTSGFELRQLYRPESKTSSSVVSYNRDRSLVQRVDATGGRDKVSSRLHLRHDYHLPGSSSLFGVGYDRRASNVDVKGAGVVTGMLANYSTRFNQQDLEVSTLNNESEYAQESLRFNNVTMRHTYRPDTLFSVATSAFANQSKSLSLNPNTSNVRNVQLDSFTSWQPDEELPFYVFGSLRAFDSVYETANSSTVSQSRIGSVSVNYSATPNIRYAVHETVAQTRSGSNSTTTTLTGGNAYYNSDESKFGSASYTWNANGGVDYQTNSTTASNLIMTTGVGQGLRLPYALDEGALDFNFNQLLAARKDGIFGQTNTLTHNE